MRASTVTRVLTFAAIVITAAVAAAAERKWQEGTWADITIKRRVVDFGPGSSGFGRPAPGPQMRALADVRRFVIETSALRIEAEDTVSIGRRSFEAVTGAPVTFALEKNAVYVKEPDGKEHKLRLLKKTERKSEQ